MEHLNLETLARLVDEAPSREERHHLEACIRCRTELSLLQGQTHALGELPDLRPPRGDWAMLEARLMSEGLLRHERSLLASTPGWMKVAAAVVLFLGGTGLGLSLNARPATGPGMAGSDGATPFSLASNTATSLDEAAQAVRLYERQYMDALVQYRQLVDAEGSPAGVSSPESRLAALEYLVAAGQAAVQQAPADPFLNGFLASAMAERQATYRAALQEGSADDWY
ncbi:MAG: hypothetical protein JSU98_05790 [Gemmatimonadales bacterium]|nr:MAG: hypothetical protein JSU98_05790 [Gemmatimonadales bacterium]